MFCTVGSLYVPLFLAGKKAAMPTETGRAVTWLKSAWFLTPITKQSCSHMSFFIMNPRGLRDILTHHVNLFQTALQGKTSWITSYFILSMHLCAIRGSRTSHLYYWAEENWNQNTVSPCLKTTKAASPHLWSPNFTLTCSDRWWSAEAISKWLSTTVRFKCLYFCPLLDLLDLDLA